MASISIGTGVAVALGAIFLSSSRTRQRAASSSSSSIAAPAEAETETALQSPPEGDEFEAWRAQRQWTRFAIDAVVLSTIGAAIVYVLAKENVDFVGELAKVFPREAALLARLASRQRQGGE